MCNSPKNTFFQSNGGKIREEQMMNVKKAYYIRGVIRPVLMVITDRQDTEIEAMQDTKMITTTMVPLTISPIVCLKGQQVLPA